MGQKEKLIERLKAKPKTFTFDDVESLLRYFGYERSNKGPYQRFPHCVRIGTVSTDFDA